MTKLDLPTTFPLGERVDLLLDTERVDEALEECLTYGHSLEIRTGR